MSGTALTVIETLRKKITELVNDSTKAEGSTTATIDAALSAQIPPLVDEAIARVRQLAKNDLRIK
jgi:hypothetical protein